MNVIVANSQQNMLSGLDIDVIKYVSGSYDVNELVEMFKSFFYSRMILDVTALHNYMDYSVYGKLVTNLDPSKIIFLLPEGSNLCTPNFLSHLIDFGIYNFTTNLNGIRYLLNTPNTLQDVEKIRQMNVSRRSVPSSNNVDDNAVSVNHNFNKSSSEKKTFLPSISSNSNKFINENRTQSNTRIIGFRNVTEHAGATTLIYMLMKEMISFLGRDSVYAIEIDKSDFQLFSDKNMITVNSSQFKNIFQKLSNASVIFVDLNSYPDDSFCSDIILLLEPTTIRLNSLIRADADIFSKILNYKIVLNKSLLLNNDVFDFENEAGIKVFYNIAPLDERKRQGVISDFLSRLGLLNDTGTRNFGLNSNKIFGLFRR